MTHIQWCFTTSGVYYSSCQGHVTSDYRIYRSATKKDKYRLGEDLQSLVQCIVGQSYDSNKLKSHANLMAL